MILLRHLRIVAFKHLRNIDLWFPRHGSILIEGHNESGKSTLFEAVYFALYGKALVGEEQGQTSLDALVPHGVSRAGVQLTIQAGTTELHITRTLTRGPQQVKHEAEVRIHRIGSPVETLSAVKAVNDCILTEMNGLDSNVLRNSCLMEQQALDRIEALSKTDREMAIAKLLGIDALQRIEGDLHVSRKDKTLLAQSNIRLDVARAHEEARRAGAEAQRVEEALRAAKARAALVARDTLAAQLQTAQDTLDVVAREMAQLHEHSQRTATLEALRIQSDEVRRLLHTAEQEAAALEVSRARQEHPTSAVITSQLAETVADIKAAEEREREQRAQIAESQRRAGASGALAIFAFLAACGVAASMLLLKLLWLQVPLMLVLLGVSVALAVRSQAHRRIETSGRAKLANLERDMIRLRARHETVQQLSASAGEPERATPAALGDQQLRATAAQEASAQSLRGLADALVAAGITIPTDSVAQESVAEMRRAHEVMAQMLQAELARLDITATQQQYGTLGEREQQLRRGHDALSAQRDEQRQLLVVALAEQGIAATGDEPMDTLVDRWPALARAADPDALTATLERARAIAGQLRQQVEQRCRQHGLDAETLDIAACQRTYDALNRELRERRLAAEMADEVFRRIVQRVLPETEMHMRALLPDLTDGRYRDVTLLGGDEQAADLRIRVWDEQAGRYVGKHLFSGGTRDQVSLALRLAFALATLPKELGAMPGFIFLDEPLSSFDDRRSQALVDVLTRGPIAKQFPQVFLISHSQSFDPAAFTCSLRMASGHVTTTTLPGEREARALWEAALTPIAS